MDAVEFNPSVTPRIKAHTRTLSSAARMQLSSSEISLYSGDQKTLNASATRSEMDASGIVWESSDTSVAAVNGSGEQNLFSMISGIGDVIGHHHGKLEGQCILKGTDIQAKPLL